MGPTPAEVLRREPGVLELPAGQLLTVDWQGKPVWILRRTPEMLAALQDTARLVDPLVNQVSRINLNAQCQRGT